MDELENELEWNDVSEPIEKEPSSASATAGGASSGLSKDSPSYLNMSGNEEPEPTEEEAPKQRQPAPRTAPPAAIDYRQLASELAPALTHAQIQAQRALAPTGPDPYQEHVENMLKKGAEPDAVKTLDRMVELKLQQQQYHQQGIAQQNSTQAYTNHVDSIFGAALDDVTEPPQLAVIAPAIKQKAIEIWQTHPEFAQHYQRMQQGQPPSAKIATKVATMASDAVCAAAGLNVPQKPVSLQSSKPSRSTSRGTSTTSGVDSLDIAQRKYYDAMKGPLGSARALQSAKRIGR